MSKKRNQKGKSNELGAFLRSKRERRGLTGENLAKLIDVTQATVSRVESGAMPASFVYVARCIKALALSQKESLEALSLLKVGGSSVRDLFSLFDFSSGSFIEQNQRNALAEESQCQCIRLFTPSLVPGPLQTRAYARSILMRFTSLPEEELEKALSLRMARADLIAKKKTQWVFLVMETALRNRLADIPTLVSQLEHIKKMIQPGNNLTFGIIPLGAELSVVPSQTFFVYDDHTIYTEIGHAEAYFSDQAVVVKYMALFDALSSSAVFMNDAIRKIDQIISDFLELQRKIVDLRPT